MFPDGLLLYDILLILGESSSGKSFISKSFAEYLS